MRHLRERCIVLNSLNRFLVNDVLNANLVNDVLNVVRYSLDEIRAVMGHTDIRTTQR